MDSKHTPGPWVAQRSPATHDGQYDFAIHGVKATVIAEAFGRDSRGNIVAAEANARLIAAAPDLLEALRWFIEDIDGTHTEMLDFDANVTRSRAALAKAGV